MQHLPPTFSHPNVHMFQILAAVDPTCSFYSLPNGALLDGVSRVQYRVPEMPIFGYLGAYYCRYFSRPDPATDFFLQLMPDAASDNDFMDVQIQLRDHTMSEWQIFARLPDMDNAQDWIRDFVYNHLSRTPFDGHVAGAHLDHDWTGLFRVTLYGSHGMWAPVLYRRLRNPARWVRVSPGVIALAVMGVDTHVE
jgi:hypothetical protein